MGLRKEAVALAKAPRTKRPAATKPIWCPRCGDPAQVLLFDSPAHGMVCRRCHAGLMALRQEAVALKGSLLYSRLRTHREDPPDAA